jgi:hypothetical protein
LIEDDPCSWRPSFGIRKSRPGYSDSSRAKNAGSIDITSSKWPCSGQSFSMTIRPSFSTIRAGISPARPLTRTDQSASPERIRSRTSFTHPGHRESVSRGNPSFGRLRSLDLMRGSGAHFGWKLPSGNFRSMLAATRHAPSAAARIVE